MKSFGIILIVVSVAMVFISLNYDFGYHGGLGHEIQENIIADQNKNMVMYGGVGLFVLGGIILGVAVSNKKGKN